MRAFIAIEVSPEVKKDIEKFQSELQKQDFVTANWTSEYHLTLKFLGEIDELKQKKIEKVLSEIASKTKRFELELKGVGAFPAQDYVRVLWVGAGYGDDEAKFLQKQIDESLEELDFEKEKDYVNHLTLARVKSVKDRVKLKKFFENKKSFGKFKVSEIKLIKSELTKKGPIYSVIAEFHLNP
ncbi:MAG: RNA 2',3'-cyclic phosphodiesterase [Candidatus Nanoarchaeia archaeon]